MPSNQRLSDVSSFRPRLAITLGDPAGIGPEVVLKALQTYPRQTWAAELTIFGTSSLLEQALTCLKSADAHGDWLADIHLEEVPIAVTPQDIQPGVGNAASGAASFAFLQAAIAATVQGRFDAIVTAPIAKSAWKAAGHHYPGQTELLAEGAQAQRYGMAFVGRSPHTDWILRALLATTHIPLAQVPAALTPEVMSAKLDLLITSLRQDFGISAPKLAIAGLNPHSGEQGQLGREEQDWLIHWLDTQRQRYPHIQLDGPVPPDTLWVAPGQAWFGTDLGASPQLHDAYLALYHDQGLIPVKLMAFDRAVNTTLGLPFVRTSPDHGTAFDIAGQGIANPTSMAAAIDWAITLSHQRHQATSVMPSP